MRYFCFILCCLPFHLFAQSPSTNPKKSATSLDRICRSNSQCVLLPAHIPGECRCPSCGLVWRKAINRETFKRLQRKWATLGPCKPITCPACATFYRGLIARCIQRQCTAVHPKVHKLAQTRQFNVGSVYTGVVLRHKGRWVPEKLAQPLHRTVRLDLADIQRYVPHPGARYQILCHLHSARKRRGGTTFVCRVLKLIKLR